MSRRTILAGIGAALAVLVLWYLFLWSPRSSALTDARDRREEAQAEVERLRVRLQSLEALQEQAPRLRSQLEKLRVAIPDQPNLAQFILEANEAARLAGIEFISITPSEPAPPTEVAPGSAAAAAGTPPAEIRLGISIRGGYFQVLDYMNRLADLSRIVVIDSIGISGATAESGSGIELSVTIAGRMFIVEALAEGGVPTTTTTTTAPGATTTVTAPSVTLSTTSTTAAGSP